MAALTTNSYNPEQFLSPADDGTIRDTRSPCFNAPGLFLEK